MLGIKVGSWLKPFVSADEDNEDEFSPLFSTTHPHSSFTMAKVFKLPLGIIYTSQCKARSVRQFSWIA